ncbi:MAG: signal peptidase II [Actinomycetota bacterium]
MVSTREPAGGVASGRNWRLIAVIAVLGVVVAAADQVTKLWATSALAGREPVVVIGDLIQFRVVYNAGAAFSIASGWTWLLTLLVAVVVVAVIRLSARIGSRTWSVALGLLLGGGVGNLIDRLFREPGFPEGHVVDFIDYGGWFVGNVADIAIVAALVLVGVLTARGIQVDGTRRPVLGERSR